MDQNVDVHVGTVSTTVRATDSMSLLNPQMLDQIARVVTERVMERLDYECRVKAERELRPSVSSKEITNWA